MDKLEIKLTLSADSTPELLRYLRGISSARDRAFILKRLATSGLSALSNGTGADAALLPSPSSDPAVATASVEHTGHRPFSPPAAQSVPEVGPRNSEPRPASPVEVTKMQGAYPTADPMTTGTPSNSTATTSTLPMGTIVQSETPPVVPGFEFLNLDALNAATAQFV